MEKDKDLGIHEVRGDYRVFKMLEQSLNCQYSVHKLNGSAFYSRLGCLILSDNGGKGKTWFDIKRLEGSMKQRWLLGLGFFLKKKSNGSVYAEAI